MDFDLPSFLENANAPLLTTDEMIYYRDLCFGANYHEEPTGAPLTVASHANLPPALIFAAEYDPLRDSSIDYHKRLIAHGTSSELHVGQGLTHSTLRAMHDSPTISAWLDRIADFVRSFGTA